MRVLDLFCGGGGGAKGYYDAGCEVVGVDNQPQPRYPFPFVRADALCYAILYGRKFDLIHASPVCKRYSSITKTAGTQLNYRDSIGITRKVLKWLGVPYVIENVPGAPLINPLMLSGTMFGLNVIRHRLFECNPPILFAPASCQHIKPVVKHGRKPDRKKHYAAVTGHFSDVEFAQESMGIDWLGQKELAQAIPPAYTRWIVKQIISMIEKHS